MDILAELSAIEVGATAFGVLYLVLAIRQNILCWLAALVSVSLSLVLFYETRLYPEAVLQVFYAAMAVYGWYQWRHGNRTAGLADAALPIVVWPARRHALAICAILALSAGLGWGLSKTDAAFPYLDSFTSVAAIVTTYMVANKVLENWLYWLVIDGLGVYIYISRGLNLLAALFVVYLVLVVVGFIRWHRDWRAQPAPAG